MPSRFPALTTWIGLVAVLGCGEDFPDDRAFGPAVEGVADLHPVTIHHPTTLGVADTSRTDVLGRPIGVSCVTCHGPTPDEALVAGLGAPETFHTKVEPVHGDLSCNSCHAEDRTRLRLADGATLELHEVRRLCAQCHGPQHRDYLAGAHGGMTGYWDLRRGPRTRNVCVDCHAPHAPAITPVRPVLPPRDRHLPTPSGEVH